MLIVIIERQNKKGNETACQKEKNKTPATKRNKKQPNEQQTNVAVAVAAVLQKPNKTYGKDVFTVAYFVCMFVCSTKYIKIHAQKLSIKDFLVLIFFPLLLWSFGCLLEFVLCYLAKYSQIPI